MNKLSWIIVLASIIGSLALSIATIWFFSHPYSYHFKQPEISSIDPAEPYYLGRIVAKDFPHKHSGSSDAERLALWIRDKLSSWGYEVAVQEFRAWIGSEVIMRNVIAIKRGSLEEQILILTNYDQAPTTVEAASDTSAAVGAVLALAHAISSEKTNRSVVFAFVDGEEWGMLGANYLAKNYPYGKLPKVAIVAEDLGVSPVIAISVDPIGQFSGYSPLWLRELVRFCASREGLGFTQPSGLYEYIQRAVLISFTDQGPLLRQGIQAIQVGGRSLNEELAREVYHAEGDVYENIEPGDVYRYAKVIECALRVVDSMDKIPEEPSYYLLTSESSVIYPPALILAQAVPFLPLYLVVARDVKRSGGLRKYVGELACYLVTLSSLLASYGVAKSLPLMGFMPLYDLYPPPPRHPVLYSPNYGSMAMWALATALLLYLAVRLSARISAGGSVEMERLILALLSVISMIHNPFGATLFLLPAAYLWIFVRPRRSLWGASLNVLLLVLGGIMIYILIYFYSQMILLNPLLMLWYLFMGVTYGLFTPASMLIYISVLAVGVRLLMLSIRTR